jgi:hypothetical protein
VRISDVNYQVSLSKGLLGERNRDSSNIDLLLNREIDRMHHLPNDDF